VGDRAILAADVPHFPRFGGVAGKVIHRGAGRGTSTAGRVQRRAILVGYVVLRAPPCLRCTNVADRGEWHGARHRTGAGAPDGQERP
jgi:hypothetical protein